MKFSFSSDYNKTNKTLSLDKRLKKQKRLSLRLRLQSIEINFV